MVTRALLVLGVLAGCSRPEPTDCDLDPHTIATWLTEKKLGTPQSERARWSWQYVEGQLFFWLEHSTDNWCTDQRPGVDTECWTAAGDGRVECQDARVRVEQAAVTGPLCAFWLPWFAADYYAHASIAYDRDTFKTMPLDRICAETGGIAIGCLTEPEASQRCVDTFDYVHQFMPEDTTGASP